MSLLISSGGYCVSDVRAYLGLSKSHQPLQALDIFAALFVVEHCSVSVL